MEFKFNILIIFDFIMFFPQDPSDQIKNVNMQFSKIL